MLSAGPLDRRISILRPTQTDDGLQSVDALGDFITVWASATPVRDGEKFNGGQMQASLTYRFQIRWSSDAAQIDPTFSVRYPAAEDGDVYGIAAVKEIGRREGIEITATGRAERPS